VSEHDGAVTAEQAPPQDAVPVAGAKRPAWLRLIVMVVLFVLIDGVIGSIDAAVSDNGVALLLVGLLVAPILAALAVLAYVKAVGILERRPAIELSRANAVAGTRRGFLIGFGLFTATIALIALFGGYRADGWGSVAVAVGTLGMMLAVAAAEEILFRGVVFRIIEEMTGTWIAMGISAVLFGGLHLVNSGATLWGALAIAIEGGLLEAAAYTATRSLWLPIGIHLAWNFAENGIFGVTVSGSDAKPGLLKGVPHGPSVISGGGFGPEASLVAIVICGIPAYLFLRQAHRRGNIIRRGASG
jgi:uncharacterized protein